MLPTFSVLHTSDVADETVETSFMVKICSVPFATHKVYCTMAQSDLNVYLMRTFFIIYFKILFHFDFIKYIFLSPS